LKNSSIIKQTQIFIGYDKKEHRAYEVCANSIKRRSGIKVNKLFSEDIPGWYREKEMQQSTDFTNTRWAVPHLMNYTGIGIFVDCDFVFLEDPAELIAKYYDPTKAIMVCKHPRYTPNSVVKMDGVAQHTMPRKNWASLIIFNNEHGAVKRGLSWKEANEHQPSRDLHQFKWLFDDDIGSIPLDWNCLDDYYHMESPKAIHYTDGGPWFDDYQVTQYSDIWLDEEEYVKALGK
jgi:hypothetical protein